MIFDKNERFHNSCKISFYWLPSSRGGPYLILIGAIPKSVQLVLAMMLIKICRTSLTTEVNCFASTSVGRNTLYSGGKYFVFRWEILCVQVRNTLCSCEKYSVLKLCNCECDNIFLLHEDLCCASPQGLPWNVKKIRTPSFVRVYFANEKSKFWRHTL